MKNNINRDEMNAWLVVRSLFLLIAAIFVYSLFIKQPCGIDRPYLSCRATGSVADWIGSVFFLGSMVWLSGLVKGLSNLCSPPGSAFWNLVAFTIAIAGVFLIWHF